MFCWVTHWKRLKQICPTIPNLSKWSGVVWTFPSLQQYWDVFIEAIIGDVLTGAVIGDVFIRVVIRDCCITDVDQVVNIK